MTQLTPIFGYTLCSRKTIRAVEPACYLEASTSASYKANVAKFRALFPLSDTSANDASDPSIAGDVAGGRGYFEARNMIHDLKTLESHLKNLTALGLAEKVLVVSMGDEIALKVPRTRRWRKVSLPRGEPSTTSRCPGRTM